MSRIMEINVHVVLCETKCKFVQFFLHRTMMNDAECNDVKQNHEFARKSDGSLMT